MAASPVFGNQRDQAEAALTDALNAGVKAGVEVGPIDGASGLRQLGNLFSGIWTGGSREIVPPDLMTALAHARQYVVGAWRDGRLVGGSVGFTWGPDDGRRLHSHVTGVTGTAQNAGVGLALKLYQAAWALSHGLSAITWTFDPLMRRNARFNLLKLGARVESYHPDFYGELHDGINAGLPTDRLSVVWDLPGSGPALHELSAPAPGVPVGLKVGSDGRPDAGPVPVSDPPSLACQIPADILELRRTDPSLAREWQDALRATMGTAMQAGLAITSFTRDGYYVLERA